MTDLLAELRAAEELQAKATKGPWEYSAAGMQIFANNGQTHIADIRGWGALQYQGEDAAVAQMDADGRHIATARNLPLAAIRERLEGLEIAICEALDIIGDKDYSDAEAFDQIRDKLLPVVRERIAQTEGRKTGEQR